MSVLQKRRHLRRTSFNVQDYGANDGSSAYDTAAIQRAINDAILVGNGVVLFPDRYHTNAVLTIDGPVTLMGTDHYTSGIVPANGIDGISINTTGPVTLRDFAINYGTAAAAGTTAISMTSPSSNLYSRFTNITILQAWNGIVTNNSNLWIMDSCSILGFQNRGVVVENANNPDNGGSQIINSILQGTVSSTAIYQVSSGNLRIINNKVIQADIAYDLNLASGAATADLFFCNNSIELIVTAGLRLRRQAATGSFVNVVISDNELGGETGVLVPSDANGVWLKNLTVTGNVWLGNTTGTNIGVNLNSMNGFVVANNVMYSNKNGTLKVSTGVNADNGVVGPNIGVGGGTFGATVIGDAATTSTINGAGAWTNPALLQ